MMVFRAMLGGTKAWWNLYCTTCQSPLRAGLWNSDVLTHPKNDCPLSGKKYKYDGPRFQVNLEEVQ